MPGLNGIEATRQARACRPETRLTGCPPRPFTYVKPPYILTSFFSVTVSGRGQVEMLQSCCLLDM